MISTPGEVIVKQDEIIITKFAFNESDALEAQTEAVLWAIKRLLDSLRGKRLGGK